MIFSGKFTVNKFHSGPDVPVNKRQFEYYVEHDWLLPYGYLFVNDRESEEAPRLSSVMWFRGNLGTEDVSAYLYYKGKQICSTKNTEQGGTGNPLNINTADDDKDYVWKSFLFNFYTVASRNKMTSANLPFTRTLIS